MLTNVPKKATTQVLESSVVQKVNGATEFRIPKLHPRQELHARARSEFVAELVTSRLVQGDLLLSKVRADFQLIIPCICKAAWTGTCTHGSNDDQVTPLECGGKAVPNSHIDIDMSIFGSKIRTVLKNLRC